MAFTKGMARPAGAGRKKGSGNKATVAAKLAAMKCDPITGMARIAMDTKNTPQLRGRMYSELAQYCYPRLRSIEMSGPGGTPIEISNVSPREIFISRINSIASRLRKGSASSESDG